jgi:rhodanese-related sulfurtransferase
MPEIDLDAFAQAHADGGQVVDVREPDEYEAGHVPGARLIPMGQLTGRLGDIDKSRPVYVVCQAGGRSAAMTDVLTQNGFDAYSLTGGTGAWVGAGRPVEAEPNSTEGK